MRRAAGLIVLLLALIVSGCSGLPTSSSVGQGLDVGAPNNLRPIRLQFEAPPAGAGPVEIVRGFLAASWSIDDDFAAARAYLTPEAADAWDPRSRVVVYATHDDLSIDTDGDEVALSARAEATLSRDGRLSVAERDDDITASVTLQQVAGEWRISGLPDDFGLWLSRFYFEQAYRNFTLTYADEGDGALLSDHRWFPLGSGLATSMARTQLLPVPDYLEGVVTTGYPAGTTLAVDAVPVVDQVARIELSREALAMTADQRRAAWAQMLRTMRQIPGVTSVELSVDGGPLQVVGVDGLPTSTSELGFSAPPPVAAAIVVRDRTYLTALDFTGWLRGGENLRPVEADLPDVEEEWTHLAISTELTAVAGVSEDRMALSRWSGTTRATSPTFGSTLTEPAFDRRGRLWIGGRGPDGAPRIWWFQASAPLDAAPDIVGTPQFDGEIVAVKPSTGGRRLAVAVRDASGHTSVSVAGIQETPEGLSLSEPWPITTGMSDVRDLTWVDDSSLAVLAAMEGEDLAPHILPVGGFVETLSRVRDPEHLVTSGTARGVVVLSNDGTAWRRVGGGWQEHGTVDDLVVPGS